MSEISARAKVTYTVNLTLTEGEARALDALIGYGFKPFIENFYDKLGKAYMEKFEFGLESLFKSIEETVLPQLNQVDEMRKVWNEYAKAQREK